MITEQALQEAIAECHGERNPNANTCMKLAAYYTIRDHLEAQGNAPVLPGRSYAPEPPQPETIQWEGDSEFARTIRGLPVSYIMPIMDELMEAVQVLQPRLYAGVIRKLENY
jgi:hypothetical protein